MAFWDADGVGYFFPPPKPGGDRETPKWKRFREYDEKHPDIWTNLKRYTFEAWSKGFRRIGAHLILQQIRWESSIRLTDEKFKVANDFFPYYARKFMDEHPEHAGVFEIRKLKEG